jgi:hypothetical protein
MRRTEHYLAPLKRTTIPKCHMALDTEARIVSTGSTYRHRMACAVLHPVEQFTPSRLAVDPVHVHRTPDGLWRMVEDIARREGQLVLWAHNLAYDIRVVDGLRQLSERGWNLEAISLARTATWCSWSREGARLTICDAFSWLPAPLAKIATDLGVHRVKCDYRVATDAELELVCQADCAILGHAVSEILQTLGRENLGSFRPTGSGQSHAALRRRFLVPKSIHVHTNTMALAAERGAMHTGRCEAWVHGEVRGGVEEWDMSLAYCRIAASHLLPGKLVGERACVSIDELGALTESYCVLAEVDVVTDKPLAPTNHDGYVIWPVGCFRTVLWDPELCQLAAHNGIARVGRVWLYEMSNALAAMSGWLIEQLEDRSGNVSPIAKRMYKHWARTLVGRMGLRYRSWEWFGRHPRSELCIATEAASAESERFEHMRIGHEMFQLEALTESYSSVPAIPGWVMSQCRVQLWHLMEYVGLDQVVYVDTDGILCKRLHRGMDLAPVAIGRGAALVCKGVHHSVNIHGPRNVELGAARRLSGVPRNAVHIDELTFEGETFSGLESALHAGASGWVEVAPRRWEVVPVDRRRIHLGGGKTKPHRLGSYEAV